MVIKSSGFNGRWWRGKNNNTDDDRVRRRRLAHSNNYYPWWSTVLLLTKTYEDTQDIWRLQEPSQSRSGNSWWGIIHHFQTPSMNSSTLHHKISVVITSTTRLVSLPHSTTSLFLNQFVSISFPNLCRQTDDACSTPASKIKSLSTSLYYPEPI